MDKTNNGVVKEIITFPVAVEPGLIDEIEMVIERGTAHTVALDGIEKGLTAMWQTAAKPRVGEQEQPVMRACVFNLVICVKSDDELAAATETITKITWSYPCRAIVLVRKPDDSANKMTAAISAHCQLPTSTGKKVCCEQITIVGSGTAADSLWSMVLPLLVPDLPVTLWWPDDPILYGSLFEHLLETADRLIVDSRSFANPINTFARLAELSKDQYANTNFSDISWARLTPWRSMLAQFFDEAKYLPYLSQIDSIEINYEAPDDNSSPNFSEALLLVGWLATQLGWKHAFSLRRKGNNAKIILNQNGTPLTVTIYGHNDRVDELGGITGIKLFATRQAEDSNQSLSATFSIAVSEDYEHAVATIEEENAELVTRNIGLPKPDKTELLCEDLTVVGRDQVFETSLELAGQLSKIQ